MDSPRDRHPEHDMQDEPPPKNEVEIRAMLEESRLNIAEGRMVPLASVLERMRTTAERGRRVRAENIEADRRPG